MKHTLKPYTRLGAISLLKHFNKELIQESDILLIAVSGGIDSMVMLHYLNNIKADHKIKIAVVHFDHQKRNDSSLDCELVKNTCKKLSIECFTDTLNIQEINDNFHDYARTKRYDFFVKIAKKINANKIVLVVTIENRPRCRCRHMVCFENPKV